MQKQNLRHEFTVTTRDDRLLLVKASQDVKINDTRLSWAAVLASSKFIWLGPTEGWKK